MHTIFPSHSLAQPVHLTFSFTLNPHTQTSQVLLAQLQSLLLSLSAPHNSFSCKDLVSFRFWLLSFPLPSPLEFSHLRYSCLSCSSFSYFSLPPSLLLFDFSHSHRFLSLRAIFSFLGISY